jgi:Ca2+-binding EF-hand superfamily protein
MTTDFQKKKHLSVFKCFDSDDSGTIEFADFSAHAHRIKKDQGWSDENEDWKRLIDAKQKAWDEIRKIVDLNNDGQVSVDEWLQFCEKVSQQSQKLGMAPEWMTRIFYAMFQSLDINKDGAIGPEEYDLYLKSLNVKTDSKAAFERVDANGDGAISLDEFEDLLLQWNLSDDPADPGNYFLTGTLD